MAGRTEDPRPGGEAGGGIPADGSKAPADRAGESTDDRRGGFTDTTGPGAPSAQAPEPGTALDDTTNTVTNTGPSS